mgnify:CR=1 FL=1
MKKRLKLFLLFVGVLFVLCVGLAYAMEKVHDSQIKNDFAKVIRLKGFVCDSCSDAYFMGRKHRGLEFRVLCNNDTLAYKVTSTPSKDFLVSPW